MARFVFQFAGLALAARVQVEHDGIDTVLDHDEIHEVFDHDGTDDVHYSLSETESELVVQEPTWPDHKPCPTPFIKHCNPAKHRYHFGACWTGDWDGLDSLGNAVPEGAQCLRSNNMADSYPCPMYDGKQMEKCSFDGTRKNHVATTVTTEDAPAPAPAPATTITVTEDVMHFRDCGNHVTGSVFRWTGEKPHVQVNGKICKCPWQRGNVMRANYYLQCHDIDPFGLHRKFDPRSYPRCFCEHVKYTCDRLVKHSIPRNMPDVHIGNFCKCRGGNPVQGENCTDLKGNVVSKFNPYHLAARTKLDLEGNVVKSNCQCKSR